MKKVLSLLLALAMVFTLVACGGNNTPGTDDNTTNDGETTEKYLRKFEHRVGIITGELTEQQENQDTERGSEPCVFAGHTFKKMIEAYERSMK